MNPSRARVELIGELCHYIQTHLDEPLTLHALGKQVGLSPSHLQRVFKGAVGISPREYVEACRLGKLKQVLRACEQITVTTALYAAGYGSSRALYERATDRLGMTPGAYSRGGVGMEIGTIVVESPLGKMLLAATRFGVSAVYFGEREQELVEELHREYPSATFIEASEQLLLWVEELLSHLLGHHPTVDLPLHVQATAFQARVWEYLQTIPLGTTRCYGEIAAELGQPGGARAVARACATNPVSVLIPCHRVIREDGHLGGYRWGLERKQALLSREAAEASTQSDAQEMAEKGADEETATRWTRTQ